jgi:hypothetical protein
MNLKTIALHLHYDDWCEELIYSFFSKYELTLLNAKFIIINKNDIQNSEIKTISD